MISVTAKSRYAVVGMAELSRHADRPVPISLVAERRGIRLRQIIDEVRKMSVNIAREAVVVKTSVGETARQAVRLIGVTFGPRPATFCERFSAPLQY